MTDRTLTFHLEGKVMGQPRPRFSTRNGHAVAYDREDAAAYKDALRHRCRLAMASAGVPLCMEATAFSACVTAIFRTPKSWSRKKREDAIQGRLPMTSRPDGDNILKIVLDAVNGLLWKDDSQVDLATVAKRWGEDDMLVVQVCWKEEM